MAQKYGAYAVGELKYLWSRGLQEEHLCSCGVPVPNCPFWQPILGRFWARTHLDANQIESLRRDVDRHRHLILHRILRLPSRRYRSARRRYTRVLGILMEEIAAAHPGALVIDSSKDPAHFDLLRTSMRDRQLVILHLIRDGRGAIHSQLSPKQRPEIAGRTEYMRRQGAVRTAIQWSWINVSVPIMFQGTQLWRVRYEDFAVKQGLPIGLDETLRGRDRGEGAIHSVAGNPVRFTHADTPIKPDQRWNTQLGLGRQLISTLAIWPLLLINGYPIVPPRVQSAIREALKELRAALR